ncbi:MAG: phosphoglycerate kinase [Candidatus Omnitrophota bacterium]|jgi:3-phosphoglycerate kinase
MRSLKQDASFIAAVMLLLTAVNIGPFYKAFAAVDADNLRTNGAVTGSAIEDLKTELGNGADKDGGSVIKTIITSIRKMDVLKERIAKLVIKDVFFCADINLSKDDQGKFKTKRLDNFLKDLGDGFISSTAQFAYVMSHFDRPKKGLAFQEKFSFEKSGIFGLFQDKVENKYGDVKVILLPPPTADPDGSNYKNNLDLAEQVINKAKSEVKLGEKIVFVFENIRFYNEEQAKDAAVRDAFAKKLISLTGQTAEKVAYINAAFDKAHRPKEASVEMIKYFPVDNIAAGNNMIKTLNKVASYINKVIGKQLGIMGGAKFDKADTVGDFALNPGNEVVIVGALSNPLQPEVVALGKSKMPKSSDEKVIKKVEGGKKKLAEVPSERKMLPVDFQVKKVNSEGQLEGTAYSADVIGPDEAQVDIGPRTLALLLDKINSLKKNDGIVFNGGTGMFDSGEKETWLATKDTLYAIWEAGTQRGVVVFFGGGDTQKAVDKFEAETGLKFGDYPDVFFVDTAGGALQTALAIGLENMPALKPLLVTETVYTGIDTVKEYSQEFVQAVAKKMGIDRTTAQTRVMAFSQVKTAAFVQNGGRAFNEYLNGVFGGKIDGARRVIAVSSREALKPGFLTGMENLINESRGKVGVVICGEDAEAVAQMVQLDGDIVKAEAVKTVSDFGSFLRTGSDEVLQNTIIIVSPEEKDPLQSLPGKQVRRIKASEVSLLALAKAVYEFYGQGVNEHMWKFVNTLETDKVVPIGFSVSEQANVAVSSPVSMDALFEGLSGVKLEASETITSTVRLHEESLTDIGV